MYPKAYWLATGGFFELAFRFVADSGESDSRKSFCDSGVPPAYIVRNYMEHNEGNEHTQQDELLLRQSLAA